MTDTAKHQAAVMAAIRGLGALDGYPRRPEAEAQYAAAVSARFSSCDPVRAAVRQAVAEWSRCPKPAELIALAEAEAAKNRPATNGKCACRQWPNVEGWVYVYYLVDPDYRGKTQIDASMYEQYAHDAEWRAKLRRTGQYVTSAVKPCRCRMEAV